MINFTTGIDQAKIKKIVIRSLVVFLILISIFVASILSAIAYFNTPNHFQTEDKILIIENGMNFRQAAAKLYDQKIIAHPKFFFYLAKIIYGRNFHIHYGEYVFEKNSSYAKIVTKMIKGDNLVRKITIAEGLSNKTIFRLIDNAYGLLGQIDPVLESSLKEGSLLPETYLYSYGESKSLILSKMQQAMTVAIDELWLNRDLTIPIKSKEEAIILASIVEKETGLAAERSKVASVFVNRLKQNMKLQSDPTVIYSFTYGDTSLERPIRQSDLKNNSPFNTYNIYGLPPTPICNPGIASIKAVLNPENTDYLYFVATNSGNGDHHFSSTIWEHNFYVAKYRQSLKDGTKITL